MKIEDATSTLKNFKFVRSTALFGSRAKLTGRRDSDFDLCIIPKPGTDVSLKDRISLENSLPDQIDLSLPAELPGTIRRRVFLEEIERFRLFDISSGSDQNLERDRSFYPTRPTLVQGVYQEFGQFLAVFRDFLLSSGNRSNPPIAHHAINLYL